MREGTVNDEELVEVVAEQIRPSGLSGLVISNPTVCAMDILAALRAAGYEVFKPSNCDLVTVKSYITTDNLLSGVEVQETLCHLPRGRYRLVPEAR